MNFFPQFFLLLLFFLCIKDYDCFLKMVGEKDRHEKAEERGTWGKRGDERMGLLDQIK